MKTPSAAYKAYEDGHTRRPIEIYEVTVGSTTYYHCSGDETITYGGNDYDPATIKRGPVSFDDKGESTEISLTFAKIVEPIASYIAYAPPDPISVKISHLFRDQAPYETLVIFDGYVRTTSLKGVSVRIECVGALDKMLKRQVPA